MTETQLCDFDIESAEQKVRIFREHALLECNLLLRRILIVGQPVKRPNALDGVAFSIELPKNRVGFVETLVVRSGQKPTVTKLCLPPGTSRPARCV